MRLDDLYLWYLGDPAPRYVGALKLVGAGKGVSLHYAEDWLAHGFALSEDLPLVDTELSPPGRLSADAPRAVGAVDDARPDRWGEKVIRFIDKPKRTSLMEMLYYAGDDRFGALGVSTSPTAYLPRKGGPLPRLAQAQELSEVVAKIEAGDALTTFEAKIIEGGGSPLGGAKPKALIDIDGEPWVIKFFNHQYVDAPLIEHAAMTLAAQADIRVAQTQVIRLVAANAVAIRRFDRVDGRRIHSISAGTAIRAATAAGTEPELGYPQLARILRRVGVSQGDAHLADARELFRRMVFNILIDNTDDHEKNHSLLVVDPRATDACGWRQRMTSCPPTPARAIRSSSAERRGTSPRWPTRCPSAMRLDFYRLRPPRKSSRSSGWSTPGARTLNPSGCREATSPVWQNASTAATCSASDRHLTPASTKAHRPNESRPAHLAEPEARQAGPAPGGLRG